MPTEKQTASKTIAIKAHAYGIRGVRVDGNDVLAVHRVVKEAVDRARAGEGPTFVEALTYRMGPHSSSDDPTRYRSNDEVETWAKKDPLARLERYLRTAELLDDALKSSMDDELRAELDAALAQVEDLGPPSRESVFEDVYAQLPPHLAEQRAQHLALPPAPLGN